MDEKQIIAEPGEEAEIGERIEEPVYISPPHPEFSALSSTETTTPEEPAAVEGSLSELIKQAVDGLRTELLAELEEHADRIKTDLRAELKGGLEINAKG